MRWCFLRVDRGEPSFGEAFDARETFVGIVQRVADPGSGFESGFVYATFHDVHHCFFQSPPVYGRLSLLLEKQPV